MKSEDHNEQSEFPKSDELSRQPYSSPQLTDLGAIQSLVQLVAGIGPDGSTSTDCTAS